MSPNLSLVQDGKKFMWDGRIYATREEAASAAEAYRNDNFEIQLLEQGGQFLVYSRRIVKEVVVSMQ